MTGISTPGALRVLHTADLHLDRSFRNWGDSASTRQQDLLDTLEQIGDLAREHQVHLVLLGGDQFDKHNPDSSLVTRFLTWLERLDQAGIQVAMISGNHDSFWYEDSVYRRSLPRNTVFFQEPSCENPVRITAGGQTVWLYGIAHDHTQQREILTGFQRRSDGDVHIGLMHATVDPRPDFDVAHRYLPLRSTDLTRTGLDFIALGHIHSARTINHGLAGMAAYPGSPEPLDAGEIGERTVALLRFDGGPPQLTVVPCGKRIAARQEIDCTGLTQEEIRERISALADDDLILSITLTGAPQDMVKSADLEDRLARHFCYLSVSDGTSVVDAGYVRRIEDERTIRGQFVRELRDRISAAEDERDREVAEMALQLGLIRLQERSAE